jgi:capsular exopolysaccharide synthesis family protein
MLTQLAEHLQAAGMGPDEDEDEPKPSGLDALISNIAIASGLHPVVEEKAEPSAESLFDWWVDELERNMDVHQKGNSFVIVLNYTSTDPSVAATVANTLAEVYIEGQINRRRAATGKATQFLKQRVGELEEELRVAEEAVHTYRAENALAEFSDIDVLSRQISDLTSQLALTRADMKEEKARLDYIKRMRTEGGDLNVLSEMSGSPLMIQLWVEDSSLSRRMAELRVDLGERHPQIVNLRSERAEIADRINRETDRIVANMRSELAVLTAREEAIGVDLTKAVGKSELANHAAIELRRLEREAAAIRQIYESFLNREKQTREQQVLVQANARVVTMAQVPHFPSGRSPVQILLIGFVASAAMASGLAFMRDRFDRALRSRKEVETTLQLPCLALIPRIEEKARDNLPLHQYYVTKPLSFYAESMRIIDTSLRLASSQHKRQTIQITSSVPGEGKTSFAVSFATLLALEGFKTILIDLDFRHPSVKRELDLSQSICLVDYLENDLVDYLENDGMLLRDLITGGQKSGLDTIGVRRAAINPSKLITSKRLQQLLKVLQRHYDYIVIDSPPVLGLSDAKLITLLVDAALFVVRWNDTTPGIALEAVKSLRGSGVDIMGAIVAQVNLKRHRRYGYGEAESVHEKYRNYYQN